MSRVKKGKVSDVEGDERCSKTMKDKWPEYFKNDPFYNINLSREHEDFRIKMEA
jgi:hypothetical protein